MSAIRIVVGKVPRMLGDIITSALMDDDSIKLIGEIEIDDELIEVCKKMHPDAVVLGSLDENIEVLVYRLLALNPLLKVITLSMNQRNTYLFELRPQKFELGELSSKELGKMITELFKRQQEVMETVI